MSNNYNRDELARLKASGMTYKEIGAGFGVSGSYIQNLLGLSKPERAELINARGGKCESCGIADHLHIHHVNYETNDVKILCVACHRKAHANSNPSERKIRSGTPPNASMILTDIELEFIADHFNGSKSAAIHYALERLMDEM